MQLEYSDIRTTGVYGINLLRGSVIITSIASFNETYVISAVTRSSTENDASHCSANTIIMLCYPSPKPASLDCVSIL